MGLETEITKSIKNGEIHEFSFLLPKGLRGRLGGGMLRISENFL
jgi:hypothetical protein